VLEFAFCGRSYFSRTKLGYKLAFRLRFALSIGISELGVSFCGSLTAHCKNYSGSEKLITCFLINF